MLSLLLIALCTGVTDSLNPVALTQQLALQGLVRKKRHIWAYIAGAGISNLAGGLAIYYGVATLLSQLWTGFMSQYARQFYAIELIAGVVLVVFACCRIMSGKLLATPPDSEQEGKKQMKKIGVINPVSLFLLGVLATGSELPTALPYFAFLTVLYGHALHWLPVMLILILYNMLYILPLMLLYFAYSHTSHIIDRTYAFIRGKMKGYAYLLMTIILAAVGTVLMFHAILAITA